MKVKKIVVPVFAICLMASLCMNMFFYQKVVNQYGLLQSVRLDPTGARKYTEANARIPEPRSGVSRIIFFGDSRMVRWNPLPDLANGQLLNRSVPGETTAQAVLRLKTDVLELKPDIAVVQIGINDLKAIGVFPEQKEKIVRSCWENLNTMACQMIDHDIQLVILTIFPPGSVDWLRKFVWSDEIYRGVEQVNQKIKSLQDKRITIIDCDQILSLGPKINPKFAQDTLHLNSAGYEALNSSLRPILQNLIQDSLNVEN